MLGIMKIWQQYHYYICTSQIKQLQYKLYEHVYKLMNVTIFWSLVLIDILEAAGLLSIFCEEMEVVILTSMENFVILPKCFGGKRNHRGWLTLCICLSVCLSVFPLYLVSTTPLNCQLNFYGVLCTYLKFLTLVMFFHSMIPWDLN